MSLELQIPAPPIPPTIILGEDKTLTVNLIDQCGKPVNISSATEIDCIFLGASDTCIHEKLSLGAVVISNGPFGQFQILMPGSDSLNLAPSPTGGYSSIEVHITIAGKTTYINLTNAVQILARLYPNC